MKFILNQLIQIQILWMMQIKIGVIHMRTSFQNYLDPSTNVNLFPSSQVLFSALKNIDMQNYSILNKDYVLRDETYITNPTVTQIPNLDFSLIQPYISQNQWTFCHYERIEPFQDPTCYFVLYWWSFWNPYPYFEMFIWANEMVTYNIMLWPWMYRC